MSDLTAQSVARKWWDAIDRQDFRQAAALLAPGTPVDWPLSNERIPTPDAWRLINEHYPGTWRAEIDTLLAEGKSVVTRTRVYDSSVQVLVISWFTVVEGRIASLVEYWPEVYAAPEWRRHWVRPIATSPSAAAFA